MKPETKSALALGSGLCLLSWLGNRAGVFTHQPNTFPRGAAVLLVTGVLFMTLRHLSHSGRAQSRVELQRAGWSVVWRAAVPFALFTTALGLSTFQLHSGWHAAGLTLVLLVGTLATTAAVGWASTFIVARWLSRSRATASA